MESSYSERGRAEAKSWFAKSAVVLLALACCSRGWSEGVGMTLPAGLAPVREWKIYCLSSSHTDIGLDRSSYWKRHGAVQYMDRVRELVAADPDDADPAAYRYTIEGAWFFDNYPQEKGAAATRRYVADVMARGRVGVSALCAGNITEAYGFEQMCRSTYARRRFEDRWGLKPRTMIMADNFRPPDDGAFKYTGLVSEPKAIHGERLGQIYLEWGLDPSPDFDHWELYRGETPDFPRDAAHFVAKVKPDVVKGLAFAVNRYDDRGLRTHKRYHYAIRTVRKDGRKGPFHVFSAKTRDEPQGVIVRNGESD